MATTTTRKIGREPENRGTYLTRENWEVMKPFVHFGIKALALVGSVAWGIIKLAPKLLSAAAKPHGGEGVKRIDR